MRDFRILWAGETVSALGSQFTVLAVPTFAILRLHAGPLAVGALTGCGFAGYPVAAVAAGPLVDRWPKRPVLLAANAVRAVVLAAVVVGAVAGRSAIWQLAAATLLLSAATAVFDAACQVLLPSLVPPDGLARANARLETSQNVAYFAGPGAAGLLIQAAGAAAALLVDAVSYAGALVSVLAIRHDAPPHPAERSSFLRDLAEGARAFRVHRFMVPVVACGAVSNAGGMMVRPLVLLAAYRAFGLSPAAGGWVLAAGGVAGIAGATVAPSIARRLGFGASLALSTFVEGAAWCLVPLGLAVSPLAVLTAACALSGAMAPVWNVSIVTLRQQAIPVHLQARVVALARAVGVAAVPVGTVAGGAAGAALTSVLGIRHGLVVAVVLGGLLAASSALVLLAAGIPAIRTAADAMPNRVVVASPQA